MKTWIVEIFEELPGARPFEVRLESESMLDARELAEIKYGPRRVGLVYEKGLIPYSPMQEAA